MALSSLLNPNLFLVPSSLSPLHSPSTRSLAITCGPATTAAPPARPHPQHRGHPRRPGPQARRPLRRRRRPLPGRRRRRRPRRLLKPDLLAALAELQRQAGGASPSSSSPPRAASPGFDPRVEEIGGGEAAGEVERDFDEWYEGGIITETLPV
uniref:Uncharacterized protein n=1 Tax=Ananas comosus var. bracteatus TaxID=296719 RepID=A0A6V7PDJ5_ANACO|nr:unnamed protein product [Ananas comosus var. bracteatus]